MESKSTVDRSPDVEMTSDNDSYQPQITHLDTHRPVHLLSAAGQGAVASTEGVAGPAPRPHQHDPVEAKGSEEVETHYISPQLGYLDTHFDQVGTDGGTKSKDLSCSPTYVLAPQPPHRFRPKDEASLDPSASRFASVQSDANLQAAGFDGSLRTHTAVDSSTDRATGISAT